MDNQTVRTLRKASHYQLQPPPEQTAALEQTRLLCRRLDNCGREQRRTWWGRGPGKAATHAQQEAELPDRTGAFPEDGAVHSPVVPEVRPRLDRACQACFRRVAAGEQAGYPRLQGQDR